MPDRRSAVDRNNKAKGLAIVKGTTEIKAKRHIIIAARESISLNVRKIRSFDGSSFIVVARFDFKKSDGFFCIIIAPFWLN
jgi:hypothetical protein